MRKTTCIALMGLVVGWALPASSEIKAPGDVAPASPPPIAWPTGQEVPIIRAKCLFCHHGEIIVSQRLGPAQWRKVVEKMTRWGAPLNEGEQRALAAYLARHYPSEATDRPPARIDLISPP